MQRPDFFGAVEDGVLFFALRFGSAKRYHLQLNLG